MFFVMMCCLFVNTVNAQIGVTVTNNTNTTPNLATSYTSLANALVDLNAVNAMSGPITLTLAAGNETTPATGLLLGSATLNPVLNSTNTVTIIGAGATTVLNAGVGTATPGSAVADGILKLVGVDYVTIDGITFTDTNITNPASMEVGLGMFKLSATDGCNNNTIRNCIFNMQTVNNASGTTPMVEGSVGIALMNSTALASTTVLTITAATGASSNNKFYSNTINGGNYGIVLRGFAASSPFTLADTNNDVGGLSLATGNTVLNFGGAAAAANPAAGIRSVDQWGANISFNTINNNNGSGVNHVSTLRGIITSGGTSASLNINSNIISVQSGATTSQLDGISNSAGSTAALNTININNNNVSIGYPNVAAASNTINGIVNASTANTVNINTNTISQIVGVNLEGTGTWIMIEGGSPGGTLNTNNNVVANITRNGASGTLRGVKATTPVGLWTCTGNTVENLNYSAVASTGNTDGIYDASSATLINISSNIVRNLSTPTTGTINGIRINTVAGTHTCNNNQVYNFSTTAGGVGGATFTGISFAVGNLTASGNTIYALNSTGSTGGTGGSITGISQSGGTTNVIFNNKIYDLSSTSNGATIYGINMSGGTTNAIYNNIIADLRATTANLANAIRGIDVASTNANVYNNTINISAASSGLNFGTSAFNAAAATNLDLKNNIFYNTSVANGTGLTTAYRRSSNVLTTYSSASNNNLFYSGTPSATNLIFNDGTNSDQTLAAFKVRVAPRENISISENPTFVSTIGSNSAFLHIDTVAPTAIESGGTPIGSVINDFDGNIRQGNIGYVGTGAAPDIGADEFEGISSTPTCSGVPVSANTITSNNNFCVGNSTSLSLDVAYAILNITYQWESSADNISYLPIGAATSSTVNASPITTTWYRCIVTCTTSAQSMTSTPIQVIINSAAYASIPLTESFESTWATTCVTAPLGQDVPNNFWRMTKGTDGDASWRADNTTTILSGWVSTGGAYTPISQDGSRSARFHSFNVSPAGDKGMLDLYVNLSAPSAKELSFYYITPSTGIDQLELLLSTDGGLTFNSLATTPALAAPATAVSAWTNVKANLATTSPTSIIRFRATGDNGSYDIGLDNVTISLICAGTPTPGATTATATTVCYGGSTTLGVTTITVGSGVTYQWQSSTDGLSYADVVGATASTYLASPTQATYYQCIVTCSAGPSSGTSTPVQITFANSVTGTTPATRCGVGTVTLGATPNSGATISWYANATGGAPLASGATFITPSISANTAYYASAETLNAGTLQFGTGVTTAGTTNLSAFNNYRASAKYQMIYTANELNALGVRAGNITSIAYNVSSLGSAATNANYTVKMATTALATFPNTTFATPTFTTCYGPSTYTHSASGWQTISFVTPFNWDGTSNVIIEVSHDGIDSSASADTQYTATVGNTVLFSYNGASNTLSTSRFNVLFSGQVACSSPRVVVNATVVSPPALTLSNASLPICLGESTSAVTITAGSTDYDTYVWSPLAGVSGSAIAGWTFNPSVSTSYILTASQSGGALCSTTTTVNIVVNVTPTTVTVTPATATICSGTIQQLNATGGNVSGSVLSGSGTSTTIGNTTASTLGPNPLQNYYGGIKQQWIYTAAELSALGFSGGTQINAIKLDLVTANAAVLNNLVIKMKNTTAGSFASTTAWEAGLTTVKAAASHIPVVGLNSFTLDTPFIWDGTNNLVIEMNYSNNNSGGSVTFNTAKHSATSFVSTIFYRVDSQTAATVDAYVAAASFTYSSRNDVTFDYTIIAPITWTPLTDLYTDAVATIPYTGTPATTVYTKPTGNITYTATATLGTCTKSNTSVITVTPSTSNLTTISACDTYTWAVTGSTYTTSGTYTNVVGCHTETLNLTINITPNADAPSNVSVCDSYVLPALTVGNYFTGPNGTGTALSAGNSIASTQTIYVYAATGTTPNCADENSFLVTITTSSSLPTEVVSACDSYTWSANGTVYNTGGIYTSTTNCVTRTLNLTINTTSSLPTEVVSVCNTTYTWSANGTVYSTGGIYTSTTNCVTRTLDLTINTATTPTGAATQVINGGVATDATIEDIVISGTGIIWYPTLADAIANTNAILAGTQLVDGEDYFAVSVNGTCASSALQVTVTVVLGNASFDLSQLNYYPNPVKDIFNVKYNKEIISVDVYDLTGRKVMEMKPNTLEVQLNMTNLSSAMYIVRLQSADGITELKVYKN